MRFCRLRLLLALALLGPGCGEQPKPAPIPDPFGGRLDAADKLPNERKRHEALRAVARDAADAGVPEAVLKAVDALPKNPSRDELLEDCALRLAKRGESRGATAVAEQLVNANRRAEVLGKIAKGGG